MLEYGVHGLIWLAWVYFRCVRNRQFRRAWIRTTAWPFFAFIDLYINYGPPSKWKEVLLARFTDRLGAVRVQRVGIDGGRVVVLRASFI